MRLKEFLFELENTAEWIDYKDAHVVFYFPEQDDELEIVSVEHGRNGAIIVTVETPAAKQARAERQ